jgi:hypothetical protein
MLGKYNLPQSLPSIELPKHLGESQIVARLIVDHAFIVAASLGSDVYFRIKTKSSAGAKCLLLCPPKRTLVSRLNLQLG